jgi:hypothetical protein
MEAPVNLSPQLKRPNQIYSFRSSLRKFISQVPKLHKLAAQPPTDRQHLGTAPAAKTRVHGRAPKQGRTVQDRISAASHSTQPRSATYWSVGTMPEGCFDRSTGWLPSNAASAIRITHSTTTAPRHESAPIRDESRPK